MAEVVCTHVWVFSSVPLVDVSVVVPVTYWFFYYGPVIYYLCLLMGELRPFIFKIIIEEYVS